MKKLIITLFLSTGLYLSPVFAEPIVVSDSDSLQTVLVANKDKRVTIKLRSGSELTGKVGTVNAEIVHLIELSGKEYFDAVIHMNKIEALIIRTRR